MALNNQPIIIKRIKKGGGGHHGGAWKVAYADFVTAMMAFFLLLWLLNATEAENLAGLADYFAPTVGVKDEMGIGFRGGKSALSEGIGADKNTNKGIVFGGVPSGPITKVTTEIEERTEQDKQEQIQVVINEVNTEKKGAVENAEAEAAPVTPPAKQEEEMPEELKKTEQAVQNVISDMIKNRRIDEGAVEIKRTPEGLMIEIKDLTGNSMFENDTDVMKDKFKTSMKELAKILKNLPNTLAVIGHTSSTPIQTKIPNYTKWELSTDRANATRSFLIKSEVANEQFSRVEGRADNVPYDKRKPESSVNNRINIIILSKNDTPDHKKTAPESILIDTKGEQTKKFLEETEDKNNEKKKEEEEAKPVKENEDVKQILKQTEATAKDAAKLGDDVKQEILNNEVIDLKVDKNKKVAPKVAPGSKDDNGKFQQILNESEKTEKGAAQLTPEEKQKLGGGSADVIDLSVKEMQKAAPVITAPRSLNDNSGFQQILKESENAAKIPASMSQEQRKNLLNTEVIDLSVDKNEKPAAVAVPRSMNDNSGFQQILNEAEKATSAPAKAPVLNREVIDLSVEKNKKEEPKIDPGSLNDNSVFKQILEESERTAREAAKAANKPQN